jgi:hypothetical protein
MSTTPPEQPTTPQQPGGGYGSPGPNVNLNLAALMPTPGNAELVVYIQSLIHISEPTRHAQISFSVLWL